MSGYYQLKSGSCGGALIEDKDECDAAAVALDLGDKTSSTSTTQYSPPGCVLYSTTLYLYPATNDYYECSSSRQCICAYRPPSPPPNLAAPPSVPPMPPGYVASEGAYYQLKSGSCGGAVIEDKATCDAAAAALGLSDTSAYVDSSAYAPPGCVLSSSSLYLYPASNDYYDCSSTRQCICALRPPSPPAPPSEPPAPPAPPLLPPGYVAAVSGYYQLKSGSCGGAVIEDEATCDAAAAALGLSDTSASTSSATYYAPGCVLRYSSLYLYPATNSPTSNPCSSSEQCICAFRPPSPPAPPSPPPTPPAPPSAPPLHPGFVAVAGPSTSGSRARAAAR